MNDQRITYIISDINKAIAFEWIAVGLKDKFSLSFILLNRGGSELEHFLRQQNLPTTHVKWGNRRDYLSGIFKVFLILRKSNPEVIHCHLFHASLIGLTAGFLSRIKRRIYTRHHSTYNLEYNWKGIWVDKLINSLATDIVAISENVKNVLVERENARLRKIHLIHHGFDLKKFDEVDPASTQQISNKYKISGAPVIGVIARWIEWKGIQYIIPAFARLLEVYPEAHIVLANARGPYKDKIEKLLDRLPENSYTIIPFEHDLFALYKLFNVYVHTPVNPQIEAFGQTYIEALAAGIPSVFTMSGVTPEFIEHEKNAMVIPFKDVDAVYDAIYLLLKDEALKQNMSENGKKDVVQFNLNHMIKELEELYCHESLSQ